MVISRYGYTTGRSMACLLQNASIICIFFAFFAPFGWKQGIKMTPIMPVFRLFPWIMVCNPLVESIL
jgi:hypothetical protein